MFDGLIIIITYVTNLGANCDEVLVGFHISQLYPVTVAVEILQMKKYIKECVM